VVDAIVRVVVPISSRTGSRRVRRSGRLLLGEKNPGASHGCHHGCEFVEVPASINDLHKISSSRAFRTTCFPPRGSDEVPGGKAWCMEYVYHMRHAHGPPGKIRL